MYHDKHCLYCVYHGQPKVYAPAYHVTCSKEGRPDVRNSTYTPVDLRFNGYNENVKTEIISFDPAMLKDQCQVFERKKYD